MHQNGRGTPQDFNQSVMWYTKAANKGYSSAQLNLGLIHAIGTGVPQSNKQAYVWLSLAAVNGEDKTREARDVIASKLTSQQLAEAQQEAKGLFNLIEENKHK